MGDNQMIITRKMWPLIRMQITVTSHSRNTDGRQSSDNNNNDEDVSSNINDSKCIGLSC